MAPPGTHQHRRTDVTIGRWIGKPMNSDLRAVERGQGEIGRDSSDCGRRCRPPVHRRSAKTRKSRRRRLARGTASGKACSGKRERERCRQEDTEARSLLSDHLSPERYPRHRHSPLRPESLAKARRSAWTKWATRDTRTSWAGHVVPAAQSVVRNGPGGPYRLVGRDRAYAAPSCTHLAS